MNFYLTEIRINQVSGTLVLHRNSIRRKAIKWSHVCDRVLCSLLITLAHLGCSIRFYFHCVDRLKITVSPVDRVANMLLIPVGCALSLFCRTTRPDNHKYERHFLLPDQ